LSRIASVFKQGHTAFIPYVTVGYPSVESTLKTVPLLVSNGADIIELGIPFSDPLADGATIQKSSFHALKQGVTPQLCLEIAGELHQKVSAPLVFMSYFNPLFNYGLEEFCREAARVGIDGLIIPDLPPEEGITLEAITENQDIDLVYMLAPSSTDERVKLVAKKSRGFIYLVSLAGVTGIRDRLPPNLETFVSRVRNITSQSLCVGFGISTPEQAGQLARFPDGVILGSRIIQLMEDDAGTTTQIVDFARRLRQALDEASDMKP
jgi:tryptophan synthase alpha chain